MLWNSKKVLRKKLILLAYIINLNKEAENFLKMIY
jgi:hypothetical protein